MVQPSQHTAEPTSIPQRNMILQKSFLFGHTLQVTRISDRKKKYFTEQEIKSAARKK
jgi:hypothetical protein